MQTLLPRAHVRTDRFLADTVRRAGIVGAGGAGFPTYVKYRKATPLLIVNGAESEPGYWTDKLLLHEQAREFARLFVFLKGVEAYERIIVAVEELAAPWMGRLERLADATGAFDVEYIPNLYKLGQERALTKHLLGLKIPPKGIPPDVGVTVNNNETLWNLYRAVFHGAPVLTKYVVVFGETPQHLALEAPVGAYAEDLLALAGVEAAPPDHALFDGGPVLCDRVEGWPHEPYGLRKTTNGLLLVAPEHLKGRARAYPRPEGPRPPRRIENVERFIHRVRVPLGGRFGAAAEPTVRVGEPVERGEVVGEAPHDHLGVAAHASITGFVTDVTPDHVAIVAPDPWEVWWP